jgi:hypothetical protein
MASITFDTLRFVHRLKDSGVPESQAEAIAEAFRDASGEAELVSKDYLDMRLADMKADLIKWMAGLLLAQAALVAALVKLI